MGGYMALRVASIPPLVFFFYGQSRHWFNNLCYPIYFYLYYAVFIASAALLFFVCIEVFRAALSAFPGLMKLGIVSFRWSVLASVIVSFSTITYSHRGVLLIPSVAFSLMRSVSIIELCLLGFLCLSMNALRLSARSMAFGIALGMGLMSANDFVQSMVISNYTSLTAPWQFVYESMILATLGMWVVYCVLPERARQPILLPVNSIILRWNEIATALGQTGGFFLTEAENAVEEALTQDQKSRA
jgi:hypothetical protein